MRHQCSDPTSEPVKYRQNEQRAANAALCSTNACKSHSDALHFQYFNSLMPPARPIEFLLRNRKCQDFRAQGALGFFQFARHTSSLGARHALNAKLLTDPPAVIAGWVAHSQIPRLTPAETKIVPSIHQASLQTLWSKSDFTTIPIRSASLRLSSHSEKRSGSSSISYFDATYSLTL